jgi:HK97 family phage portal protein
MQKSLSPAALSWLRADELDQGTHLLTNAYQQVVWVYRSINVLAEQVANIPFLFSTGQRGSEHLITTGPLWEFYSRPHPQINRFQYWELRIIWLMLRGECFRIPIFENDGLRGRRLKRVLLLDPEHFQHVIVDHQLVGWRYTGFGPHAPLAAQVFLPEEVWFEKLPNPFNFWRGLPPLQVAAMAARTDFAASAFMRGIIENNADTGVIVRADRPLAPEQQEQLLGALRDRKRRAGRADQPLLITGCAEIIKPQLSSSDLQFLENRRFSRSEICAAFGVPEEILTATEHAKYDVMQGARLNFIENRVAPLCGRLEAEEEATVKAIDEQAIGWFDLDSLPLLQNARRERLAAARTGFEMGIPFNELNRVLDLGFKALPWGETGFVPAKLRPLNGPTSVSTEDTKASMLRLAFSPGAKVKVGQLRRFFFEQRGRVLEALDRLIAAGGSEVSAGFATLLDLPAENEKLIARTLPQAEAPLGAEHRLAVAAVNQSTLESLKQSLNDGLAQGESLAQLAARVRTIYNHATDRRAADMASAESGAGSALNKSNELTQ